MVLDESEQKVLADLKRKRGVVKSALTRIRTFVSKFHPTIQAISLLEFRQEELPKINQKFDDIQSQIELLAGEEEDSESERDKFEEDYFAIRSQIQELSAVDRPHSSTGVNASFAAMNIYRAQLAPIPLPKFNGNIQEWASFCDIFRAMVHNDDNYTAAQKFFYLRSCLVGPALDLVRSIPISDGNYETVIGQLVQRYDNHSLVIQSHIRSILDCPRVEDSTPRTLQTLYSTIYTHVAALKSMGQPVEHWDAWLITIVTSRLDRSTVHSWQLHHRNSRLPKYSDLEIFIASRCTAIETSEPYTSIGENSGDKQARNSNSKKLLTNNNSKKALISTNNKSTCPCCSGGHRLFMCEIFKGQALAERLNTVRTLQLCFNCLAPFHFADDCKSKYTCLKCKQKHNTLLHYEKRNDNSKIKDQASDNTASAPVQNPGNIVSFPAKIGTSHVFLSTASVLAIDKHGQPRNCRIILDNGSQVNFISKNLFNKLQLPTRESILPINGIGASHVQSRSCVDLQVKSRVSNFELHISCYVLPVIVSSLPKATAPEEGWKIPDNLYTKLADPSFSEAGPIDLLIGGGAFFDILEPARIHLEVDTLCLQDSKFGWIMTGEIGIISLPSVIFMGQSLEENWRALKDKEEELYGRRSKINLKLIEEKQTVEHFKKHTIRSKDGQFIVQLPLKSSIEELGDTLKLATTRFLSLERRFIRDEKLRNEYIKFMEEYIELGHMQLVTNETKIPRRSSYLPHHAVLKESSLTTRVRVVFDASAKGSSGISLNDMLMRGPNVQENIFSILIRFRKHQYALTSDIEKMFRQVAVARTDWDLQRIVWRSKPSEPLQTFRLTTVTYGTTSASFLATQCLLTLAEDMKEIYPNAAKVITRDFYMDDLITGAETIEECISLQAQISTILNSAKLPLRKWCSNSSKILESVNAVEKDHLFIIQAKDGEIIKSLGLCWKPSSDELGFQVVPAPIRIRVTKRILLSDLNRIFDPLGLLTPVLIKGKIFLQQLWQMKMDWDKPLPEDIAEKWQRFHQQLEELGSLSIPRKCKPFTSVNVELHGFCDASEEAYGACIYVRCKDQGDQWYSRLLCSKSRVAPLKGATIPRLELGGALILAQLASKVAAAWDLEVRNCHLWTDSMVVLGWICSENTRFKTYVANRVEQILELTNSSQWKHVKTAENPADVLSRGITPQELKLCELWWKGPQWLLGDKHIWKQPQMRLPEGKILPEQRTVKLVLAGIHQYRDLVTSYSSWQRLVRATAWIIKFIEYRRSINTRVSCSKFLSVAELKKAENGLIRQAQLEEFGEDIRALIRGKEVPKHSKLKALYPLLRQDNVILVGGRLNNAQIAECQKHQIVLPARHKVTRLIFEYIHGLFLHCGPQALLAHVRQRYWPLRGRIMARSVTTRCITCIRARPKFEVPLMAALPKDRVLASRPFTITGIDFAGPLMIRSGIRRVTAIKTWIAVFVCFATRAIHLEAVVGLTSEAFIAALRRFMSRRGKCAKIFSDNGTNFVGAQKELSTYLLNSGDIMAREGIDWHFNPPSAPHFGGIWESAVKSTKAHLLRIVKDTRLSLEELQTLLCQIEACVNSRPMTPLGEDPSEPNALTPAHFLVGGPLVLPPEPEITREAMGHVRKWKFVQGLMQTFWRRWYDEYLPQLQVRGKWYSTRRPLIKNDVVIIKEDCTPPTRWKLGRVMQTHPGSDGIVRVVTVQTANGAEIRRPVAKLCRLPVESDEEEVEKQ